MTEFFQALVEFRFMQHALLACLLASLGCGVMGVYMVVKRIGFSPVASLIPCWPAWG